MNQLSIFASTFQSILTYCGYDLLHRKVILLVFFSAQVLAFLLYGGPNNDQKFIGH